MTALPKEIVGAMDRYRDLAVECERTPLRPGGAFDAASSREDAARDALEAAILADRERLAAESGARRLVLVLKATELRQEWLRAERAEEALRPFARMGEEMAKLTTKAPTQVAWGYDGTDLTFGDFARARAVLPAPQPAPEMKP